MVCSQKNTGSLTKQKIKYEDWLENINQLIGKPKKNDYLSWAAVKS